MEARQRQENLNHRGDAQSLLVGGLEQYAGALQGHDRVLDFTGVAGTVVGVWRPEAGDGVEELFAIDEDGVGAVGAFGPEPLPKEDQQDGFFTGVRYVMQQGREAAIAVGDGLALERDLSVQVDVQVQEQIVEPGPQLHLAVDERAPLGGVLLGADVAVLDEEDQSAPLLVGEEAFVTLE